MLSVRYDFYKKEGRDGKPAGNRSNKGWLTATLSMQQLADHVARDGNAISISVFTDGYRKHAAIEHTGILGLDMEAHDGAGLTAEQLAADEFLSQYAGVITPSASDTPESPRNRVYIPLSRSVTTDEYKKIAKVFIEYFGDKIDAGVSSDPSRFFYGSQPDLKRVYVNDNNCLIVDTFIAEFYSNDDPERALAEQTVRKAENYGKTLEGSARLEQHLKKPLEERERLTIECLDWVLTNRATRWTRPEWLQVAMSAWHGSDGSGTVRDYILMHPKAPWTKEDDDGREAFRREWDGHTPREGGYSFASLLWLARHAGWLSTTGLEIPSELTTTINERYVTSWLEKQNSIPNRLLVISQTASGKTFAIKHIYERLNSPKTVIFVPSIKLAMELAGTLKNQHGLPATLYINPKTGRAIPTDQLVKAQLLVTTLQTYATKVHSAGNPIADLVIIEESDQLIQQFSKGGGGIYSSHVNDRESRTGYACLRDAFANAGHVMCFDATMTQVTYQLADSMKDKNTLKIVRNAWVEPKQPVTMLQEKGEAYQEVLKALQANKTVVLVADTAQVAEEVVSVMLQLGVLTDKKYLLITRKTERSTDVHQFMSNVEKYAPQYDFVAYNSVMASGVSIMATRPDVIVQICTYLTPRVNLQLLNRYRRQAEIYCYYTEGENLYAQREQDISDMFKRRAEIEASLVNIPLADRTLDATLKTKIAAISVADEAGQRRSPKSFYCSLLAGDGREVKDAEAQTVSKTIEHTIRGVRRIKKEENELIAKTWQDIPPIDRDNPAKPEYTDLEVAQGETHALIERALAGHIPTDVPAEEIYQIVKEFNSKRYALVAFMEQSQALTKAEEFLADRGRAISTLSNHITLIKLITSLHHLYHDPADVLTEDILAERVPMFMANLMVLRDDYDAVISNPKQKFIEVLGRDEDQQVRALAFSKIILAQIGLKQRSKNGYHIANMETAKKFLSWRQQSDNISFTADRLVEIVEGRADYVEIFHNMSAADQTAVIDLMQFSSIDFQSAVEVIEMGIDDD